MSSPCPRGAGAAAAAILVAGALAACSPTTLLDTPGATTPGTGPVAGEVLGTGATKVAMLLPLSASGNAGQLAKSMRNAAELALREFQNPGIQIIVKDDRGTPDGARAATSQAISEGATLILGPLFAQSVSAAASVAKPANIPIVAFSNDSSTASRGVYLMSFLPQTDVDRVIRYSVRQGKQSFAALLPANAYGSVVEASLQSAAAKAGGRIVTLERYNLDRASMQAKATAISAIIRQGTVNAVFLPDTGDATPFLAQILAANGVKSNQVRFLGSGNWNDPRIIRDEALNSGWFPAPDNAGFAAFAARYKAAYGSEPLRNSTLAYDATSLAAGLTARFGAQAFSDKMLTTPSGFLGIDGAFRFLANGTNQRALAIFQVERGAAAVIDPAPKNFTGGAGLSN